MPRIPALLLLTALMSGIALAGKPHVHGAGTLDVVVEAERLTIMLEMPADAVLGYERAPRTAAEKAAAEAMMAALRDGANLFRPAPEAACVLTGVQVADPFAGTRGGGDHADVDANYEFRCSRPAALKSIETTLFARFKRLYRLDVQRAGPAGQGSARLAPKDPVLRW